METLTRWVQGKWFFDSASRLFRGFVRLFYGLHIHGLENIPERGGAIVASNHISAFDPPVIGVSVPREVNFMAKRELFASRLSNLVFRGLRAFPVDRQKSDMRAIKEALRRLEQGVIIGIFTEGTRNRSDGRVFDGASFLAQRAQVPIVPTAIWREGRSFHVRFDAPIMPQGKTREEASQLTERVMARVQGMMPPLSRPESGGSHSRRPV